jgi:predicted FMN-binding regulatory protein PaiB
MARKLADPTRTKALVNDAWNRVKAESGGVPPNWNYMAVCQLVDRIIVDNALDDARDLTDALVLCWRLDEPATKANLLRGMKRVDKGRQGVASYR